MSVVTTSSIAHFATCDVGAINNNSALPRLDAVRAARIRNNPKEEQALLDEARALAASEAAKDKVAGAAAAAVAGGDGNGHHPAGDSGRGRGQGSGRGRGKACVPAPRLLPNLAKCQIVHALLAIEMFIPAVKF